MMNGREFMCAEAIFLMSALMSASVFAFDPDTCPVLFAQAVLPGYLTDPSVMKSAMAQDKGYQTPERLVGCTWKSTAPFAVTKAKGKVENPKELRILDRGNKWAPDTAMFNAAEVGVPAHWTTK